MRQDQKHRDPRTLLEALYWANYRGYKDNIYSTPQDLPLSGSRGRPNTEKAVTFGITAI